MPAGIEIYNNNNVIQITDKFKNMQFIRKDTVYLSKWDKFTDGTNRYHIEASWTLPEEYDITKFHFAFRAAENQTFTIFGPVHIIGNSLVALLVSKTQNIPVTVYVFGHSYNNPGDCFEVYNDEGEIVFSDSTPYMKVITSHTGYYNGTISNELITTTTSDRTMAILPGNVYYKIIGAGNEQIAMFRAMYSQGFTFSGNTLYSRNYILFQTGFTTPLYTHNFNYNFLVIDVTDL